MPAAALLILARRLRHLGGGQAEHGLRRAQSRQGRAGALPSGPPFRREAASPAGAGARAFALCVRAWAGLWIMVLGAGAEGQMARAADGPAVIVGGGEPKSPCVTVDIAGYRAGPLDCATQKLEAAARTAQAQARAAIETPVIGATSPDVRTGVANQTATRQRMGNSFGISVQPQRPNRLPPPPRPGGRP